MTTVEENPQLAPAMSMWSDIINQLNDVDEALDSTQDAQSAGQRALRNSLVKQFEGDWKPTVDQFIEKVNTFPEDQRVGVVSGFVSTLTKTFEESIKTYLAAQVEANKSETPEVKYTEDQVKEMEAKRSALYKAAKSIREMAFIFGGTEEQFPMPKKRTGTRGKRGKRAISLYTWSINGEALEGDNNNLVYVAEKYGFENAAALRKSIQESLGLKDLKNPPNPLSFVLPDSSVLSGVRPEDENVSDQTDDGDDDDDEDDDDDQD